MRFLGHKIPSTECVRKYIHIRHRIREESDNSPVTVPLWHWVWPTSADYAARASSDNGWDTMLEVYAWCVQCTLSKSRDWNSSLHELTSGQTTLGPESVWDNNASCSRHNLFRISMVLGRTSAARPGNTEWARSHRQVMPIMLTRYNEYSTVMKIILDNSRQFQTILDIHRYFFNVIWKQNVANFNVTRVDE